MPGSCAGSGGGVGTLLLTRTMVSYHSLQPYNAVVYFLPHLFHLPSLAVTPFAEQVALSSVVAPTVYLQD